jgi:hypothetical protein
VRASTGNGRAGGEADKALVAVLAAAIVLLLLAGNVQLWRLAERGPEGRARAANGSSLPPPVSGTSNEALSRQIRLLTKKMTAPLNGLSGQLVGLQDVGGAQRDVARQIAAMDASLRSFGAVRGEINRMSNGLGAMVANTGAMTRGLATMGQDMRATRTGMTAMVRVMRQLKGGIAATSASSREATEGIVAMRAATAAMAESIAATAANGREMTTALGTLNTSMRALLQLFCLAFNSSTSQCAEEETSPPATGAASGQPTAGSHSPGELLPHGGLAPALPLGPASDTRLGAGERSP